MTTILILEGNDPTLLAQGKSAAALFVRAFQAMAPDVSVMVSTPYVRPVRDEMLALADGAVFTGSGVDWSTDAPEAAPLRAEMERVFGAGRPVWGSCNGAQLAAVVLGGAVGASPNGVEIGLAQDVVLTEAGRSHAMLAGRADGYAVPCIHRDEVQRLPEGAVLLSGNAHSSVQAFAYEANGVDFWGAQYHPEMSAADVAASVGTGPFTKKPYTAEDLARADTDAGAAARVGAPEDGLALPVRTRELANWLAHVQGRAA